jgi:phosphoglycerol transferase MdoB-like AlkP superfamily enzyme
MFDPAPTTQNKERPEATAPIWRSSRFGFVALQWLALVCSWSLLRLILFFKFHPPAAGYSSVDLCKAFLLGFHLDLAAACCVIWPLLLWCWLLPNRPFAWRLHRFLLLAACFLFWTLQTFLLFVEYYFFEEFESRFNTVAIDYILYPSEVFVNIWESYPVVLIVAISAAGGLLVWFLSRKIAAGMWNRPVTAKARLAHIAGAAVLTAALFSTASFHEARFSNQRVLNEIANNGAVSLLDAAWSRNLDYSAFYLTMPKAEAYTRTRRLLTEPGSQFAGDEFSLKRRVSGDSTRPRLNVVVLLEESLGSEFWGCLGRKGESLTPYMDQMADQGMLFENIYASGNRTVRGFEGVLSSFPPLPGDSIVKRDRSENVETIARVLKRDGYATLFLYGGRGLFDGMRAFAVENGYDRFIERKDFPNPTFTTIWGVCDEDLYRRTILELRQLNDQEKPFFATVLSVSNHKPYTYPANRIAEDPKQRRRENAVKYTDWALGRFFDDAHNESFWTNTIFVLVADHGARVYGSQTIPIHSYEIPLLILGPAVIQSPSRQSQLGGQLDVAPTILGLLGRPHQTLFFGRDLLKTPPDNAFVLLNHNRDIGLYKDSRMVILNLNKQVEFFHGNPKVQEMIKAADADAKDRELEQDALALFQVADDLYMNRRYRLDAK